jgi:MFS family permease
MSERPTGERPTGETAAPEPSLAGTARLPVVFSVSLACFLCQSLLHYALPLYFPAKGLPHAAWETWSIGEIIAWLVGPPLAGFLGSRWGERRVWTLGLAAYALVALWVVFIPSGSAWADRAVGAAGLWYGFASSLIWVGGISLAQVVPASRRGLSNSLMMTSLGLGSIGGPILGRALVGASAGAAVPAPADFLPTLGIYALVALLAGIAIFGWGQYAGSREQSNSGGEKGKRTSLESARALLRSPRFLALVIPLSLLGGPVFQATNVYRPYRVRDPEIGLIVGAADHGWAALEVTGYVMQLVGGALIGLIAGRRASGIAAAGMLGAFAFCCLGIGLAPNAAAMFAFSALFELVRQFMRWVQTGYLSEHMPEEHRAEAIGISVTLSGVGSWAFNLLTRAIQSPDSPAFNSSLPFAIAAGLGFLGTAMLVAASRHGLTSTLKSARLPAIGEEG